MVVALEMSLTSSNCDDNTETTYESVNEDRDIKGNNARRNGNNKDDN